MDSAYSSDISDFYEQKKAFVNENSCNNITSVIVPRYTTFTNAYEILPKLKEWRKNDQLPNKHHFVLRPTTYGVHIKHLRKLARMGGDEYLGELAYNRMACEICKIANDDDNMILCDRCNGGFHIYCLCPSLPSIPADDWYCAKCKAIIDRRAEERKAKIQHIQKHPEQYQSKIFEFFHASPDETLSKKRTITDSICKNRPLRKCRIDYENKIKKDNCTHIEIKSELNENKKSNKLPKDALFKCYEPSVKPSDVQKQLLSLLTSMMDQEIEFNNSLVYPEHIHKSMNNKKYDITHVREMTSSEKKEYNKCKELWSKGLCTPVLVKQDPIQGFVVYADADIPKNTLLCEYCGILETVNNVEHCDNDSIMDLLYTKSDKTSLVILPNRKGNLARYMSGINNFTKEGRKKQNVFSCRIALNSEVHLLLISKRSIKKGELLAYDYNGYKSEYPTEHFI